jgi:polysaccharide biosynthesis protein PslG
MRTRLLKIIASFAGMAALAVPSQAGAANSFGSQIYGISPGGEIQSHDATTQARQLDELQTAGAKWLRVDINWAQIQRGGPTSYDWSLQDRLISAARARGMQVIGTIVYTPNWARPSGTSATYGPDPATYAAFAREVVRHYSPMGVNVYEIWNEPNVRAFWTPSPNAGHYARLIQAAYPLMKSANPDATILTGGTAPSTTDGTNIAPVEWLRRLYANGAGGFFDGVAHHPYCWPANPGQAESWSAWYQMYGTSPSIRSHMVANGDGAKKIWATEYGAPTNGPAGSYVSESTQASMISRSLELWKGYDWAGPIMIYSGRDLGTDTGDRENFYGLLRYDFSRKPSFAAYREAATGATDGGTTDGGTATTPTDTTVKSKGGRKVRGRVSTDGTSRASAPAPLVGQVQLRLERRRAGGWKVASRAVRAGLRSDGTFTKRVRAIRRDLRRGVYRVHARYTGGSGIAPSASRSNRFRVR